MVQAITTWEVFIPASEPALLNKTLTVEAANWMDALKAALVELGQGEPPPSNLMLDIKGTAMQVTDVQNKRVFEIRPVSARSADEAEAAPKGEPEGPSPDKSDKTSPSAGAAGQSVDSRTSEKEVAKGDGSKDEGAPADIDSDQEEPEKEVGGAADGASSTISGLVAHEVFFNRDEKPTPKNRLTYGERLIAVEPGTTAEEAEAILEHHFALIMKTMEGAPRGRYINLAVFDHVFRERAEHPAIAALDWKDWRGAKPLISFPQQAPAVVETSYIPGIEKERERAEEEERKRAEEEERERAEEEERERAEEEERKRAEEEERKRAEKENRKRTAEERKQAEEEERKRAEQEERKRAEQEKRKRAEQENRKRAEEEELKRAEEEERKRAEEEERKRAEEEERKRAEEKERKRAAEEERKRAQKPAEKQKSPRKELGIGRDTEPVDFNEVIVEVFEAMQDLYSISSRRECVEFAVALVSEKIPCQAVAGLAKVPSNDHHMKCVAAKGSDAEALIGRAVPIRGTILGLAVHQAIAVGVSDVQNDPRISADIEHLVNEETRSLLCVPFAFEGRNFGAVELVNRINGDAWRQREIHLVSYIGNHLAEYIAQSLPSADDNFEADFAEAQAKQKQRSAIAPKAKSKPKAVAKASPKAAAKAEPKPKAKSTGEPKKSEKSAKKTLVKTKSSRKPKKRKKR